MYPIPVVPYAEDFTTQILWAVFIACLGIGCIVGVMIYIFQSLGLYAIAKRRGLKYPGLAWVPLANNYIFGGIADDFNQRFANKKTNNRHFLCGLGIGNLIISTAFLIPFMRYYINLLQDLIRYDARPGYDLLDWLPVLILLYLLLLAVSVTYSVFSYIALHKIYKSCTPNYVALLVLSILFGITPFVLFAIRNKDIYPLNIESRSWNP